MFLFQTQNMQSERFVSTGCAFFNFISFNGNHESVESTVNTISNSMSQCCWEKLDFNACEKPFECKKTAKVQSDRAGSSETRSRGCRQALTGAPGSDPRQPYSERQLQGFLTFRSQISKRCLCARKACKSAIRRCRGYEIRNRPAAGYAKHLESAAGLRAPSEAYQVMSAIDAIYRIDAL